MQLNEISCSNCGYSGQDFKLNEQNFLVCPACKSLFVLSETDNAKPLKKVHKIDLKEVSKAMDNAVHTIFSTKNIKKALFYITLIIAIGVFVALLFMLLAFIIYRYT